MGYYYCDHLCMFYRDFIIYNREQENILKKEKRLLGNAE